MKMKFLTYSLLALLMFCTAALTSCNKDDNPTPALQEETFDINNPKGYFLYVKASSDDFTHSRVLLYEFAAEKNFKLYHAYGVDIIPYTLVEDTIIHVGDNQFIFNGNTILSNRKDFQEIILIKAPKTNELTGKTFTGTYYNGDGSMLHENFFYSFATDGNTIGAGFNVGTTVRTESYTLIGNFAAFVNLAGTSDNEFMVLVNGKLEVNYKSDGPLLHYGTFAQQ